MTTLTCVLMLFCAGAAGCGPLMDDRQVDGSHRVRAYLDAAITAGKTPGIQYLVVDSAGIVFEYVGGWADLRQRVPMSPRTTMMAYSMSKTIAAAAVLQLVESGKVGLDDRVDRYVDASPYGPRVTVRQLLSHTGGIPNPIPLRWVHPAASHGTFDEALALGAVLRQHPRLEAEPGTKYAYSNIGYWLLGCVVERASGMTFEAYVTQQVIARLHVSRGDLAYTVPDAAHHAAGYLEKYSFFNVLKGFLIDPTLIGAYAGRWLRINDHYPNGPAFGGLVGTARGFGAFLEDQLRSSTALFNDTTRALFYAQQRTTSGRPVAMTLGWHIGDLAGRPYVYKEGGGGGFHAMMRVYPAAGVATVLMVNATGFNVRRALNTLDREFLR